MNEKDEEIYQMLSDAFEGGEKEIDRVSLWLEKHLIEEEFEQVDQVFDLLLHEFFDRSLDQLDIPLTFLMTTNTSRDEMPHRQAFVSRLREEVGDPSLFSRRFSRNMI